MITGCTGQLGNSLGKLFKSRYDLVSTSRTKPIKNTNYFLDITNSLFVKDMVAAISPNIIINLAALTNVDLCESNPDLAHAINFQGVKNLVNVFKGPIIHLSTDYVFDGTKGSPYTVKDTPNSINVYGASKLAGEKAIAATGGDYCIVRTSWLYSEYGVNFQTKILEKAKTDSYLEVVSDLYGTPTYAPNLVVFLLNKIIKSAFASSIEHFSDGKTMSWYDLAKKITQKDIRKVIASTIQLKAKRPKDTTLTSF